MGFAELVASVDRAAQDHLGGEPVTYAPKLGEPVEVTGIFDARYVLHDAGQAGVETVGPAVWLRLEDLPIHPDDDEPTITIAHATGAKSYKVRERPTDGIVGGSIVLLLQEVG